MRRQPLKVANASNGDSKAQGNYGVMISQLRVPKNSLMTKNNTNEAQHVDINN